jgi:hypothetical protein
LTQDDFLLGVALVARRRLTLNPPNDNGFDSSLLSALVGHGAAHSLSEVHSSSFVVQKSSLKSGVGHHPAGIIPRVLKSSHVGSQSLEKHEKASNHLSRADSHHDADIAKAFDPNNVVVYNVLSLGSKRDMCLRHGSAPARLP